ncbi:MAG: MBL fold metallo-hydrolase [Proteobacteria bacterium]|nr:MBL fold metallo-hydrolase [Pseudomonadota bacterium]
MEPDARRGHVLLTSQDSEIGDRPTRRKILQYGASAFFGANLALSPPRSPQAAASVRGLHTLTVGQAKVTIISDGKFNFPQAFVLPDRKPAEIDALFSKVGSEKPSFDAEVNVVLIRMADRLVLVDTGGGTEFLPTLGRFPDLLQSAGIASEDITDVVFTHAHPDHFWGVIDPFDGMSRFPNARLHMTAGERDYWLKPGLERSVPPDLAGVTLGTQRRLSTLKDQVEELPLGQEIVPGLLSVATPGHTPGHISLHLTSQGENLFLGGDVLIHPIVSFAEPAWRWGADVDWPDAARSRARILDMLASDQILLLGYHLPWPGLGRVERHDSAYRWIPV